MVALVLGLVAASACSDNQTPTAPTQPTGPTTATFASAFTVNGSASRTFTTTEAGTVTMTLDSAGPPSNVVLGLGVGVPYVSGAPCLLTSSITTAAGPGPHISMHADPGSYCVKVYDIGKLIETVSFSISITHP